MDDGGKGEYSSTGEGSRKGWQKGKNAAKKKKEKKAKQKRARDLWVCVRHDACLLGEKR